MNDEHNEQILWFTRRIIELETANREAQERYDREVGRLREDRRIADALAEVVRAVARGEPPERYVAREPYEDAMRAGDQMLPLEQWKRARPHTFFQLERTIREPSTEPWP